MTEADATESEEASVPFPVAITWENIKTGLTEIKRLSNDMCVAFTLIRSTVLIFSAGQSGKETEITT